MMQLSSHGAKGLRGGGRGTEGGPRGAQGGREGRPKGAREHTTMIKTNGRGRGRGKEIGRKRLEPGQQTLDGWRVKREGSTLTVDSQGKGQLSVDSGGKGLIRKAEDRQDPPHCGPNDSVKLDW